MSEVEPEEIEELCDQIDSRDELIRKLQKRIEELERVRSTALDMINRRDEQIRILRDMLRRLRDNAAACPCCGTNKPYKCGDDCELAKLLGE